MCTHCSCLPSVQGPELDVTNPPCYNAELIVVRLGELGEENMAKTSPRFPCCLSKRGFGHVWRKAMHSIRQRVHLARIVISLDSRTTVEENNCTLIRTSACTGNEAGIDQSPEARRRTIHQSKTAIRREICQSPLLPWLAFGHPSKTLDSQFLGGGGPGASTTATNQHQGACGGGGWGRILLQTAVGSRDNFRIDSASLALVETPRY